MSESDKPVAILITEGAHDNSIIDPTINGNGTALKISKGAHSNTVSGLVQNTTEQSKKRWWLPVVKFIGGLLSSLLLAYLVYRLGWN